MGEGERDAGRGHDDRLIFVLVAATGVACIAFVGGALFPQAPGAAHPTLPGVAIGGAAPSAWTRAFGWLLGVSQVAFFGACFALGTRPRSGPHPLRGWIGGLTACYALAWTVLVALDAATAGDPAPPVVLGFPLATAFVLFAFWPLPVLFVALYVWRFESVVFGAADEARLLERLDRLRPRGDDAEPSGDAR